MLQNCKSAQERWGGVSTLIDRWLQERQEVLVDFCALGNINDFDSKNTLHGEKLKAFCELLVDYASAGHFEIYDQLVQECKDLKDSNGLKVADALFHTIDTTTEIILDFNDKYLETDDLKTLATDLSELGVSLEARFSAEDQMINVLHTAHSEQILSIP